MKTGNKSTLSLVTKGLTVAPPQLLGADLSTKSNQFYFFNGPGGHDFKFQYSGLSSCVTAYEHCSPVTSVLNKKAQAFINGQTYIVQRTGDNKNKEATGKIADSVRKLLDQPNPFQSQMDFEAQLYINTQLFGFAIVLPIVPVGYKPFDAQRMWVIPSNMIDVEETKKNWTLAEKKSDIIKSIVVNWGNEKSYLPVDDLIIIRDISVSFSSIIFPQSRVKSVERNINNIIAALEARYGLIVQRGSLGIISPDSKDVAGAIPLLEKDKLALQEEFLRYGLTKNQFKYIISNAAVKFSPMSIPTKDLMLFEEVEDDIMRICDQWNFPYPLMSSNRTNSLGGNNIGESKILLYQDGIIPESDSICKQLTRHLGLWDLNMCIIKDYSNVQALQSDKLKDAQWRSMLNDAKKKEFDAGLITLDQWLDALGEEPLPNNMGQVRVTDTKNNNVPLAVTIGVGGVEGLISVLTAQGMSDEARQATLEIVFGLAPDAARRMSVSTTPPDPNQQTNNNQQ